MCQSPDFLEMWSIKSGSTNGFSIPYFVFFQTWKTLNANCMLFQNFINWNNPGINMPDELWVLQLFSLKPGSADRRENTCCYVTRLGWCQTLRMFDRFCLPVVFFFFFWLVYTYTYTCVYTCIYSDDTKTRFVINAAWPGCFDNYIF